MMGGCDLDLREAELEGPEVTITAVALTGAVDIVVPEGYEVEMTGFAFMGGRDLKVKDVPRRPGTSLIRVRAFPLMGGVMIRSKASQRPVGERREQLRSGSETPAQPERPPDEARPASARPSS